jgi:DNA-binding CsgD family transcriptional regulator
MHLTPKEKRALRLLLECMTYREIGEAFGSTEQVIKNLMKEIRVKIGADDKAGTAIMCLHHPEWLDLPACPTCGMIRSDSMTDEERAEAIRDREEEIKQVRHHMETASKTAEAVSMGKEVWCLRAKVWQRILHREEAALEDLKRAQTQQTEEA